MRFPTFPQPLRLRTLNTYEIWDSEGKEDPNIHVGLLHFYRRLPAVVNAGARVAGLCPQFAFDLQKAVVLSNAFATAGRTGFDLTHAGGHR